MAYSTSTLAQGCFGKVYKEKYNDTWAAIKKVPRHLIDKKDLERECEVYNKAEHPNIVKLLGNITLKDGKWVIPLEFIFGEDLETTIFKASKSKIQLTAANKGTIITGMCEGLLHLHLRDIVHQDLKPENIMVEHVTNRAVIIDLGLAKFFRHGLNSAANMGNEAYSAPEVLQRHCQRDQRSDVWAMGKIIAELCARIRLYTPSVCPTKIKETLKDQPYCHVVCRMVESDPSLRASMAAVMNDIRRAGNVSNPSSQRDTLRPPSPQMNTRCRSASPANRGRTPIKRDPLPMERVRSPFHKDPSPMNRGASPFHKDPSPMNRGASPFHKDPSPMNRGASPFHKDPSPMNRGASPFHKDPSPMNRGASPFHKDPSPMNRDASPFHREPLPIKRSPSPFKRDPLPAKGATSPFYRDLSPHLTPNVHRTEVQNQLQVLKGGSDPVQDFAKISLYAEAAKDLPCHLPTTGRVVVRRFEEKNGEVEKWEQTEVVTRDGKIVKYDDVKFNSK